MTLRAQKQARESIRGEVRMLKSRRAEGAMHVPAFIGALQTGSLFSAVWQRVTMNERDIAAVLYRSAAAA